MAEYLNMKYMRYLSFGVAIVLGLVLGAYYGLEISPVNLVDTTPDTLRIDYKTDYVLMVAEAFSYEEDANLAVRRLGVLGSNPPIEIIQEALVFAVDVGYSIEDLAQMAALEKALSTWNPALDGGGG